MAMANPTASATKANQPAMARQGWVALQRAATVGKAVG